MTLVSMTHNLNTTELKAIEYKHEKSRAALNFLMQRTNIIQFYWAPIY